MWILSDPSSATYGKESRRFAGLCLFSGAVAQILAAIIFFYAANWWNMDTALKLGILMAALMVCAAGAALSGTGFQRSCWATAGAILSGVLFAVHGQIWQTGANAWELFALWTGLALVWALLTEADSAWCVTSVVAATAFWLWVDQTRPWSDIYGGRLFMGLAAVVAVVLIARLIAARRPGSSAPAAWFLPLHYTLIATGITVGGLLNALNYWPFAWAGGSWEGEWYPPGVLLLGIALGVGAMVLAPVRRFGPWPFALGLIQAVILTEAFLIRIVSIITDHLGLAGTAVTYLLSGGLILLGLAVVWYALHRRFSADRLSAQTHARLHFLMGIGIGAGAWIAVIALAAGLLAFLELTMERSRWYPAVFAAVFALSGLMCRERGAFASNLRAALLFGVYVACIFQVAFLFDLLGRGGGYDRLPHQIRDGGIAAVVLLPLLILTTRNRLAGAVGGIVAVTAAVCALLANMELQNHPWGSDPVDGITFLFLAGVCAVIGVLCCLRERPSARALGVTLLLSAFIIPATLELLGAEFPDMLAVSSLACRVTATMIGAGLLALVVWIKRATLDRRLVLAGVVMLPGSLLVPAGAAGLVAFGALSVLTIGRPLVVAGFILAVWSISRFYYSLVLPLDEKALYLALGALITFAAWALVKPASTARPVWRPIALAFAIVGALVPIFLEAWDGLRKSEIVDEGREIFLSLRPVDPRSLIQGDYMDLRYSLIGLRDLPNQAGLVYLKVNEDSVAVSIREGNGTPDNDEIMLVARPGPHEAGLAPTSFLFQEGTAETWARARYAVVRILEGSAVLTGLADEDRQRLDPNKAPVPPPE